MSKQTPDTERKAKPLFCVVVSDSMNKSRVGRVDRIEKHRRYFKHLRRSTKVMFHDENNETKVGDQVLVTSSRPLSARKKFSLLKIVRKGQE